MSPVPRKAPSSAQFATPDITPAQILAAVAAVASQAVAWGVMTQGTSAQLVSIAGIILPAVWAIVDSVIRHGRATGSASK
jgi:hypothetical protein